MSSNPHRPVSVLVVDDSPDAAESAAELLKLSGCLTRVALSGGQAVRAVAEEVPDVVLLDIGMPGMDGWETARCIRESARQAQPVIVAVTGYGREEDKWRSADANIDMHLVKPVDYSTLMKVVDHIRLSAPR